MARFIPGGRTAATFTSGLVHLRWLTRFAPYIFVAAILWSVYAALLGYLGGRLFEDRPIFALLVAFGIAAAITVERRGLAPRSHVATVPRVNRLAQETSPYLLQHADNPVDWYPWGEEALARARDEDKPILLSVGYAACHWCHVMEHESFEDEDTAALMNEHFVPVKVDREERPDVDSVYMDAVVSLTGHGGWPMTVFLTPAGEPFFGGTYYPPEPRHGLPSFKQLLQAIADAWRERRADIERDAGAITEQFRRTRRALARAADRPRCCPMRCAGCGSSSTRSGAVSAPRRNSRRRRRSSSCCGAESSSRRRKRSTQWRSVGCTTSSAEDFTATPSTANGSCRTSRRCCTTTRSSCPRICTAGS